MPLPGQEVFIKYGTYQEYLDKLNTDKSNEGVDDYSPLILDNAIYFVQDEDTYRIFVGQNEYANKSFTDELFLSSSVQSSYDIGGIKSGDTLQEGTDLTSIIVKLLSGLGGDTWSAGYGDSNRRVVKVSDPIDSSDAATKNYVDLKEESLKEYVSTYKKFVIVDSITELPESPTEVQKSTIYYVRNTTDSRWSDDSLGALWNLDVSSILWNEDERSSSAINFISSSQYLDEYVWDDDKWVPVNDHNLLREIISKVVSLEDVSSELSSRLTRVENIIGDDNSGLIKDVNSLRGLRDDVADINDRLNDHSQTLQNHETIINNLEVVSEENSSNISELEDRLEVDEQSIASNTSLINEHTIDISTLRADVNTNTEDINSIKDDLREVADNVSSLENSISDLTGRVSNNETDISNLNDEVNSLKSKVDLLESKVDEMNTATVWERFPYEGKLTLSLRDLYLAGNDYDNGSIYPMNMFRYGFDKFSSVDLRLDSSSGYEINLSETKTVEEETNFSFVVSTGGSPEPRQFNNEYLASFEFAPPSDPNGLFNTVRLLFFSITNPDTGFRECNFCLVGYNETLGFDTLIPIDSNNIDNYLGSGTKLVTIYFTGEEEEDSNG